MKCKECNEEKTKSPLVRGKHIRFCDKDGRIWNGKQITSEALWQISCNQINITFSGDTWKSAVRFFQILRFL